MLDAALAPASRSPAHPLALLSLTSTEIDFHEDLPAFAGVVKGQATACVHEEQRISHIGLSL